ncbi:hypothetical protein DYU05_17155 [Mucilaginibacter terrenus]|uniref:Uncharacterized protein n=1 Tax=Mucilaginibacter terrenus TaxID=2482727 RepID=A0A3E2NMV9_9SPHI|nr:hypothetical protein [Mucilaginibacter terrenus]RFZ82337.1 hypothetical protein DYU05_17155 [Mucilaginibacter terrenus]
MSYLTSVRLRLLQTPSTLSLIIFSILFISGAGLVWACADIDYDDNNSVFAPEYFVNKHYTPFFYDGYNRYYGYDVGPIGDNNRRYNDLVVAEWQQYLGQQLSAAQINFLLFKANTRRADSLYKRVATRLDGRGKTFFNYLPLSKDCESYAVQDVDYWYEKVPHKQPAANIEGRINRALATFKNKFIRQRLWFQLVRNQYFSDTTGNSVKPAFYKYEKEFPRNLLYYRTLGYLAGAEYAQKDYAHANYHYSLCYNYTWQMYLPSEWSFHPQEEADWRQTLKLAKTPEERITLWHLLGINNDAARAIKEIAAINPGSEKLDLLLSRLVNMAEEEAGDAKVDESKLDYQPVFPFNNDPASVKLTDEKNAAAREAAYNKALIKARQQSLANDRGLRLVDSISAIKGISKPYYWHMAAGYLHYLHYDVKRAQKYYALAKNELPVGNSEVTAQYKLLSILLYVRSAKHMDAGVENYLVEPLNWLANLRDNKTAVKALRFQNAIEWMKNEIGNLYIKQHQFVKANFFKEVPHIYTDSISVDSLEKQLLKVNKSPFEKAMARYSPVKYEQLYYHQALIATYKEDIGSALKFMIKAKDAGLGKLPADPFTSRLNDCHDCDANESNANYTSLKFLQVIQQLKEDLRSGKNKYNAALKLGNAYYNITHYGNSRVFFQTELTGYAYQPDLYDKDYRDYFTSPNIAEKYYKIALANAPGNEQKAKLVFLLSKCERNRQYNEHFANDENYEAEDDMPEAGERFKELKSKYSATNYYKEVLKECGYFRKYAEGR